jgi:HEXXH motif-containing protein
MIGYHRLSATHLAGLASGLGGPAAVAELAAAQHSKHLLLLRYVTEAWPGEDGRRAADVLIEADRRKRRAVAGLLGDPLVGAWLAGTARRIRDHAESAAAIEEDLAQLGALASAAAFRSGIDARLRTRSRLGRVTLPTVGTADLGSDGTAVVTVSGGRVDVKSAGLSIIAGGSTRWHPLRHLTAAHRDLAMTVAVEDANPYRDCYHAAPADRLSAGEVDRWQALFTEAWELLAEYVPERAAELAAGLRSMVPLVTDDSGVARSGTARDAFGTLGLTRPRSGADFAITLVHEFQHSKLSALLALTALHTSGGPERHFAPWRADPRPTPGLLQGVYAFVGVADTWRALRAARGFADEAAREFAIVRRQVHEGLTALETSMELTVAGREFVAGLRSSVDRLWAEPVPAAAAAAAEEALSQRRHIWEQHVRGVVTSPEPGER